MILHSLVSSLLPADYREQVLGDLHERGFRLRDVAGVLPRVWASYFVRSLTGPAPRVDLTSVEALIVRTQQLSDQGRVSAMVALALSGVARVYPLTSGLGTVTWMLGSALLLGAVGYFGRGYRSGPEFPLSLDYSHAKRLREYRQQISLLRSQFLLFPVLLLVIAKPGALAMSSLPGFAVFLVLAVLFVVWTQLRRRQLQREFDGL